MKLLLFLAEHAGETCTREEIMASVWPGSLPNEEALTQGISKLRKALGDGNRQLLETIRKVGYRLNGQLSPAAPSDSRRYDRPAASALPPKSLSSKRWVLSLAAMLLVAFAISRFKVIAIHHDGIPGPRMVKIRMSDANGVIQARRLQGDSDSTLVEVLTWVEDGDEEEITLID